MPWPPRTGRRFGEPDARHAASRSRGSPGAAGARDPPWSPGDGNPTVDRTGVCRYTGFAESPCPCAGAGSRDGMPSARRRCQSAPAAWSAGATRSVPTPGPARNGVPSASKADSSARDRHRGGTVRLPVPCLSVNGLPARPGFEQEARDRDDTCGPYPDAIDPHGAVRRCAWPRCAGARPPLRSTR